MAGATNTGISARLLDSGQLKKARDFSLKMREELDALLASEVGKYTSEDTSLVVFGSLARGEWTSGSDLDWTYLIDGEANPEHLRGGISHLPNVQSRQEDKRSVRARPGPHFFENKLLAPLTRKYGVF